MKRFVQGESCVRSGQGLGAICTTKDDGCGMGHSLHRATGPACRMSDVTVKLSPFVVKIAPRDWRGRLLHARGFTDKFRLGPEVSDMRKHVPPSRKKLRRILRARF
ncbi:MAG: hypothetical protein SGI98_01370 [Verrucomicrobiota bacterium]|nr:hypothetical protein [Verrucomicrobiota bacterium]